MRLSGKTAIVTGAASGFGAGIARKFVAEGARVMIADLNTEGAEALARDLGDNTVACTANVAKNNDVEAMLDAAQSAFGQIDILINNAGTTHFPAQIGEFHGHALRAAFQCARIGVFPECRFDGRCQSAPAPELVQCLKGVDEQRHQRHGRRACAAWHSRQRDQSRGR